MAADSASVPPRPWWRRRGIALMAIALATGLAVALAKPAYRQVKLWRARSMATAALADARAGKIAEALRAGQAAYNMAPFDPATLRTVAELQAGLDPKDALVFYQTLAEMPDASLADRAAYVRTALRAGQLELASAWAKRILDAAPGDPQAMIVAAEVAAASRNKSEAVALLRRAAVVAPGNPEIQYRLGRMLLLEPSARQEGWSLIESASAGASLWSLRALELLAARDPAAGGDRLGLAARIRTHPEAGLAQRLLALRLDAESRPAHERPAWIESQIPALAASPADRLEAGRWLNQNGYFEATLRLLPQEAALQSRDATLVRLDALARRDRWDEIAACLAHPRIPLEPALREIFLARTALERGAPQAASVHWTRAQLEAKHSPEVMAFLASYAERIGAREEARQTFRQLASNPITARRAFENLVRLSEEDRDTAGLLELLTEIRDAYPEDPAPANDVAYLELLLQRDPAASLAKAETLAAAHPQLMSVRTTLALAYLRHHRPQDALALYEGLDLPIPQLLPGWQAVYAATLAANGRRAEAGAIARRIPRDRLKPEEAALIKELLN